MSIRNKKIIIVVISLFILLAGVSAFQFFKSFKAIMRPPAREEIVMDTPLEREILDTDPDYRPPATFLIYGVDAGEWVGGNFRQGRGRADTIILFKANFAEKTGSMLSIPRDTLVQIPGRSGDDKINHSYAYGKAELLVETVEEFTGIPVDYYVGLNYSAFKEIVDNLGGVEFEVDRIIRSRGLVIQPGLQVLDGDSAFAIVSSRYDPMGDIARVKRQQRFVRAVAQEVREQSYLKALSIAYASWKHIDTNIPMRETNQLVHNLRGIKDEDIEMEVVPGWFHNQGGVSYWKADEDKTYELILELFHWS